MQCFEVILNHLSKIAFCRQNNTTEGDKPRAWDAGYAKDDAKHLQASTT